MKWTTASILVFTIGTAVAADREELTVELLEAMNLEEVTGNQFAAMFEQWESHIQGSEVDAETRQELDDLKAAMAAGMAQDLADAYADQMTDSQLRDAVRFWSDPQAQQWTRYEAAAQANFFERFQLRMMEMAQEMSGLMTRLQFGGQEGDDPENIPEAVTDRFLESLLGATPGAAMEGVELAHHFASSMVGPPDAVVRGIFPTVDVELTTLDSETRVVSVSAQRAFDNIAACQLAEQDLRGLLHSHFHPGEGSPCAEKRLQSPDLATTVSIRCSDANEFGWNVLRLTATHEPTSNARMSQIRTSVEHEL